MKPRTPSQPRKARLKVTIGEKQIEVTRRGDALMLKLLARAGGEWVEPKTVGILGDTLSRHAATLRRDFAVPVETEAVEYRRGFYNRHRLTVPIAIEGGGNAA